MKGYVGDLPEVASDELISRVLDRVVSEELVNVVVFYDGGEEAGAVKVGVAD